MKTGRGSIDQEMDQLSNAASEKGGRCLGFKLPSNGVQGKMHGVENSSGETSGTLDTPLKAPFALRR